MMDRERDSGAQAAEGMSRELVVHKHESKSVVDVEKIGASARSCVWKVCHIFDGH